MVISGVIREKQFSKFCKAVSYTTSFQERWTSYSFQIRWFIRAAHTIIINIERTIPRESYQNILEPNIISRARNLPPPTPQIRVTFMIAGYPIRPCWWGVINDCLPPKRFLLVKKALWRWISKSTGQSGWWPKKLTSGPDYKSVSAYREKKWLGKWKVVATELSYALRPKRLWNLFWWGSELISKLTINDVIVFC